MEAAAPGGGSIEGTIPWPSIDLAALWEAGNTLSSQAQTVSGVASDLAGAPGRVGSWSGGAADAWHANVKQALSGVDEVSQRLGQAGRAVTGLYNTIQGLQTNYINAVEAEQAAGASLTATHANSHGKTVATNPPGSAGWFLAAGAKAAAIRAEQQAVDEVHAQARTTASRLVGLFDSLPAQMQLGPASSYRPGTPSRVFLATLLGSVVGDNRLSGLNFQNLITDLLDGSENNGVQRVWTQMSNGSWRWVNTKPDLLQPGDEDSPGIVIEIKNTPYQWASSQIRAQIQLAEDEGSDFQLVVQPGTKISGPLRTLLESVEESQGSPSLIYANGDGTGTAANGDPVVVNTGTSRYGYSNPGSTPPDGGGSVGVSPTGGDGSGSGDDGGGGDGDPDPDPDPVDPGDGGGIIDLFP
jgi:hypothetical protein